MDIRRENLDCDDEHIEQATVFETDLCEMLDRIEALEAENAKLREVLNSVLADVQSQSFDPGDCPDWFDGMVNCDSLRKLWLIFYPEDTAE